ncbi:MAG: major capsid protein [Microviridae sp.]|nr:MAG: major capsid protein [Microviridae sp.]
MAIKSIPDLSRTNLQPIAVPRTARIHAMRGITSLPAGKMVPIGCASLLREDALVSGRLRFTFEMNETAEVLMNAVNVSVKAYLVPFLALQRFEGSMDLFNRSWEGIALGNEPVVPWIEHEPMGAHGSDPIYKYLGLHARPNQEVNTCYKEAYNAIWNFRATNRSKNLTLRNRLDDTLAPAFWVRDRFKHIVPDFDQAVIDGEVALNVVDMKMPLRGLYAPQGSPGSLVAEGGNWRDAAGKSIPVGGQYLTNFSAVMPDAWTAARTKIHPGGVSPTESWPDIYTELQADGITVSLSNIEMARKTQAFARLREQFAGHSDEYIINLLMDGLTVPDKQLAQPMLIGQRETVFGMSKRYASDGENLSMSAVNGATFVDLSIQTPRIPTGGVIMVVAEITPDQLFERQMEPMFHCIDHTMLPHYLRDTLDPEKVEVVPCEYVDVDHSTPDAAFGYAPLGYRWHHEAPHIGGKFYRPEVDAEFDEDRQRIWAVETVDPTLSTDFYLCTNIHQKPFLVTTEDPFECVTQGDLMIQGNTVFGGVLVEASENYKEVMEKAPQDRIDKVPVAKPPASTTAAPGSGATAPVTADKKTPAAAAPQGKQGN